MQSPKVVIVDNFYPDLNWVYPFLASQHPRKDENVNYAGVTYPAPLEQLTLAHTRIKTLFGMDPIDDDQQGRIRLTLAKDNFEFKSFVHLDDSMNVLIYLGGKETTDEGTNFYSHKELGLITPTSDELKRKKVHILLGHDTKDLSKWEIIQQIPFKLNRAIFFDGRYFHSPPKRFYGEDLKTGRITQNFFYPHLKAI